mmetsp:Transcript_26121/g.73282  ORF Transcript_26121/g.73282 Transcript_26121/m.73282 type:complete len:81 (+) Transcript_26121:1267-1509(+)
MATTIAEKAIANSRSGNLQGLRSMPSSSEASSLAAACDSLSLSGSVHVGRRIVSCYYELCCSELEDAIVCACYEGRCWSV